MCIHSVQMTVFLGVKNVVFVNVISVSMSKAARYAQSYIMNKLEFVKSVMFRIVVSFAK